MNRFSPVQLVAWNLFGLVMLTVAADAASPRSTVPTRLGKQTDLFDQWMIQASPTDARLAAAQVTAQERNRTDNDDAATDEMALDAGSGDSQSDYEAEEQQRQRSINRRLAVLQQSVSSIRITATPSGATPRDRAKQLSTDQPTIAIAALGFGPIGPDRYTVCWTHRPLYYEQPNLERCGNGYGCWQNKISAAQFLWSTALLPYHLGRQPCNGCVRAGGDCLCGQEYPCDCELTPCSGRGTLYQAATRAGFSLLLL